VRASGRLAMAPRDFRLEAIDTLPDLFAKLTEHAQTTAEELRQKIGKAQAVAVAFREPRPTAVGAGSRSRAGPCDQGNQGPRSSGRAPERETEEVVGTKRSYEYGAGRVPAGLRRDTGCPVAEQ
jgi:hypothetical protein